LPKSDEGGVAQLKVRLHDPEHADLRRDAAARGVPMNAVVADAVAEYINREDDAGFGLLLALVFTTVAGLGPAAAAIAHPERPETARDWMRDPFAYDQMVQAVKTVLEGLRPPGERLPRHLRKPRRLPAVPVAGGPPVEIDLNAEARAFGEGSALLALRAITDPNALAPSRLRRLGERIRERFPAVAEYVRTNIERYHAEQAAAQEK
jgi:hypothetical protein